MQFSTLNESHLHRSLKILYSEKFNGKTEFEADGHIFDILTEDNEIIEIQTKSLANLLPKLMDCLGKGYKVTLVHPVETIKIIETYDSQGKLLSSRKSPKKGNLYSLLRELTGIYPILLNTNFKLITVDTKITEIREKQNQPVQSKNNKRRFKKDWIKKDKKLNEIIEEKIFDSADKYLKLLPEDLENEFCAKDLKELYKKQKRNSDSTASNLLLWLLYHLELIEYIETRSKSKYYRISR